MLKYSKITVCKMNVMASILEGRGSFALRVMILKKLHSLLGIYILSL